MNKVTVTIDIEKFITDVKDTGEVGALYLFMASLVDPAESDLRILASEFPELITLIDDPSEGRIIVALRKIPNLKLDCLDML